MELRSKNLAVSIDDDFPRIIQYSHINGSTFAGQTRKVSTVHFNGKKASCAIKSRKLNNFTAHYHLDFTDHHVVVTVAFTVGEHDVEVAVIDVKEAGEAKLMSLAFPGNALLSMDSSKQNAEVAAVIASVNQEFKPHQLAGLILSHIQEETLDKLANIEATKATGNYFFMADGDLAVGIASNHYWDIKRTGYSITETKHGKTCRAWCPEWAYRAIESETVELPYAKVFITTDINGDSQATWQDAAIAYRKVMPMPVGAEFVKSMVGENIAMNFASGAQWPFLRILDGIKKIHRATDGLGNQVIVKGFSAEGHDSANTDYCGHYNERAGGLKDLNILLENAGKYNARTGIHINITEAYPEAHRYNPKTLLYKTDGTRQEGWQWLDRSYYIDTRKDLLEGNLLESLQKMKQEMPKLDFVYIDKDHRPGWESMKVVKTLNDLGLPVSVECGRSFDPWTTWAHGYGGGVKSQIMHFLWYSQRDLFDNDPILRGGRSDADGYMGWQGKHDFNDLITGTFSRNIPQRYLKHFELLHWVPGKSATFSNGVTVSQKGQTVTVRQYGHTLMTWTRNYNKSRLFAPWDPINESKIYVWDEVGDAMCRHLPESWKEAEHVYLYKLTDQGRSEETILDVTNESICLHVAKNTPYVIYPEKAPEQQSYDWGEGSLIKDPDFYSNGFDYWKKESTAVNTNHIRIDNDTMRRPRLVISGNDGADAEVSQIVSNLKPGQHYAAEVWVQIKGNRRVTFEIQPLAPGSTSVSAYLDHTNVCHSMANDPRNGTNYQRLVLRAQVPQGCCEARVSLKAAKGAKSTVVECGGLRLVEANAPSTEAAKHWFYEDFECTALGGFGPFTCNFGERTHLSESNAPHTDDTINGNYSLKSRGDGRVVRTVPGTLRFKPKTRYRFSCETLASPDAKGRITVDSGGKVIASHTFPAGRGNVSFEFTTTNDTESFISVFKDKGDYIVIDDIAIDEEGVLN